MTKYCHIFPDVNLPLTDHKLALGVPPPDVVDNCKLDQSWEDERSTCAHPNIQRLSEYIYELNFGFA